MYPNKTYPKKRLALMLTALVMVGAACSDSADVVVADPGQTSLVEESAADTPDIADMADTADTSAADSVDDADATSDSVDAEPPAADPVPVADGSALLDADGSQDREPGGGRGPGANVSADDVGTVDELVALIDSAYGDAALGLHRGHQPVESTLIDFLDITHDEMHVRMEQHGQNLEAISTDSGLDYQDLIDDLVASWGPAIDNLVTADAVTAAQADAYLVALEQAFTYRVTWNGSDARPSFTGI